MDLLKQGERCDRIMTSCVCVCVCVPPALQTSIMDSEYNMDPNCLSRCSTELLSEASWEQVDKTDAEVRRSLCRSGPG